MSDRLVTLTDIEAARERLAGRIHRTPMLSSTTAARLLEAGTGLSVADGRIHVKAENLQRTGSFKPRGALNRIATLGEEERRRGAITMSAGNAGQAYAWAGRAAGVPVTVVMPEGAVRSKVDACRGYGAEIVLHGSHVGEVWERVQELVAERDLTYVPPFDDPMFIAGNGTAGLEIVEDLPEVDVVVVAIGGGGLISGVAAAVKERRPQARVFGVEPENSRAMSLAVEQGEIVHVRPQSVADGLGAPFAGEWTLTMVRRYVDEIVIVDDATILGGLRFAAERMKQVLEPAGAAALAAVLYGHVPLRDGERVCVLASGGNVEIGRLGELIGAARPLPAETPRAAR